MNNDKLAGLAVAETAAAIMDTLHEYKYAEQVYESRKDEDGMVGLWMLAATLAIFLDMKLALVWNEGSRDFIDDVIGVTECIPRWIEAGLDLCDPETAEGVIDLYIKDTTDTEN